MMVIISLYPISITYIDVYKRQFCVMASPIDDLKITAPCAILVEASTGEVILEKNAHEPRPIRCV